MRRRICIIVGNCVKRYELKCKIIINNAVKYEYCFFFTPGVVCSRPGSEWIIFLWLLVFRAYMLNGWTTLQPLPIVVIVVERLQIFQLRWIPMKNKRLVAIWKSYNCLNEFYWWRVCNVLFWTYLFRFDFRSSDYVHH